MRRVTSEFSPRFSILYRSVGLPRWQKLRIHSNLSNRVSSTTSILASKAKELKYTRETKLNGAFPNFRLPVTSHVALPQCFRKCQTVRDSLRGNGRRRIPLSSRRRKNGHDRCLLRMTAGVSRRLQGTILFYIHGGLVRHSRADKPLRHVPVD